MARASLIGEIKMDSSHLLISSLKCTVTSTCIFIMMHVSTWISSHVTYLAHFAK